jgi:hypothetical protein
MTKNTFDYKNHLLNLCKLLKKLYKTIKAKLNLNLISLLKNCLKKIKKTLKKIQKQKNIQ